MRVVLPFLICFVSAARADVTGSILGTVTDPSSAVLPGVVVAATNLETNLVRSTRSEATGQYRILALPAGKYKVEASLTGFQKFLETGIEVTVNEQRQDHIGMVEQDVVDGAPDVGPELLVEEVLQLERSPALVGVGRI